jgi:hypothetical protein
MSVNCGEYLFLISSGGSFLLLSVIANDKVITLTPSKGYLKYIIRNSNTPIDHISDCSE